ncbi:hypothetical protein BKA63DRAFT_602897 [Paraphoma chrysanthemicola]|nr:hypothetical protein BKA63DRAFT_602897 [Paraphoma chrysanthemicola]
MRNPSVGSSCNLVVGNSYCVERSYGVPQPDPTPTPTPVPTTSSAVPTKPSPTNGVSTPKPIQDGMVSNCNKFYFVVKDDTCYDTAAKFSISLDHFYLWNPAVGTDCKKLFSDTYVCVGLIGSGATPTPTPGQSTTVRPSTTKATPTNGISTPTPVQSGMVNNCDDFYLVKDNEICADIVKAYGISLEQFYAWNPAVGNTCSALRATYYVCVSTVGVSPSTLKTTIKPTSTSWVKPSLCTFNLSKGEYVCPSANPTPTTTKGGVATPTPVQSGMTGNCKRFYKVVKDDGCWAISNTYKIALDDFYKWNLAVGSSCAGLQYGYYVCVGI